MITPCNKVSMKINCLNKQFSKVKSKVCLTVSKLVNLVSALMYPLILYSYVHGTVHAAIIFSGYFVVDCEQKYLLDNY